MSNSIDGAKEKLEKGLHILEENLIGDYFGGKFICMVSEDIRGHHLLEGLEPYSTKYLRKVIKRPWQSYDIIKT